MQSTSLSPRKKLIRKNSKTSPTKAKLVRTRSLAVDVSPFSGFSLQKTEQCKSIEDMQNQLSKLSHNDKLSQVQSITMGQLKKICNFVHDKQSVSKLQQLMEEEKVGDMLTEDVDEGQNIIDLEQIMKEKVHYELDCDMMNMPNQNDYWISDVGYAEEPATEPWWSMKEDDMGGRLDLF